MRNVPHATFTVIGLLRSALNDYRKQQGWSRETMVQQVVEAHERIGAAQVTGLEFAPPSRDLVAAQKVNAERVYRWLDDEGKDNNLLPANMLPSVLAALPLDRRLQVLNQLLNPLGVDARSSEGAEPAEFDSRVHLKEVAKESTEAVVSLSQLTPDASPAEIEQVVRECVEAEDAASRAVRGATALLARARSRFRPAA